MEFQFYLTAFATLFVIVDPIALVPMFIALTRGMDDDHRRRLALRACLIAAVLLALFGLVGNKLLDLAVLDHFLPLQHTDQQ